MLEIFGFLFHRFRRQPPLLRHVRAFGHGLFPAPPPGGPVSNYPRQNPLVPGDLPSPRLSCRKNFDLRSAGSPGRDSGPSHRLQSGPREPSRRLYPWSRRFDGSLGFDSPEGPPLPPSIASVFRAEIPIGGKYSRPFSNLKASPQNWPLAWQPGSFPACFRGP